MSVANAEEWTNKLSPRMREAFKTMARDDWKPQRAAELSEQEKRDLKALWDKVQQAPPLPEPPPVVEKKP